MWSEGGWTDSTYAVACANGDSPLGPFARVGRVLDNNPDVGLGAEGDLTPARAPTLPC